MDRVFSFSQRERFVEYENLDFALAAGEFAIVKLTPTVNIDRFKFYNAGEFGKKLMFKGWTLRLTSINNNLELGYDIIDSKGRIKHYYTSSRNFEALGDCIEKFMALTSFSDFSDEALAVREKELTKQQISLQKQIEELRAEIERVKRSVESISSKNK